MKHAFRTWLVVASASLLSLTVGCSGAESPMQPRASAVVSLSGSGSSPRLEPIARFRQKPQVTIAWAKKWIGPEGGKLEFQGFVVSVPAGAVTRTTQFSIRLPVDPNGSERVIAEFGPHGTAFRAPVTIEFPYRGTTLEGEPYPRVVWWNDNQWWDMGGSLTPDGARVRTTTWHFSTYGTTTESRGGGMSSSGG